MTVNDLDAAALVWRKLCAEYEQVPSGTVIPPGLIQRREKAKVAYLAAALTYAIELPLPKPPPDCDCHPLPFDDAPGSYCSCLDGPASNRCDFHGTIGPHVGARYQR